MTLYIQINHCTTLFTIFSLVNIPKNYAIVALQLRKALSLSSKCTSFPCSSGYQHSEISYKAASNLDSYPSLLFVATPTVENRNRVSRNKSSRLLKGMPNLYKSDYIPSMHTWQRRLRYQQTKQLQMT